MTEKEAGNCVMCRTKLYYLGEDYPSNIKGGVDVYMKPHYGSKFADASNISKSVKCMVCDCCFEEMMKSLNLKSVLGVTKPFP